MGGKTTNPAVVVSELDESLLVLLRTYLVLPATWFKCSLLLKSLFKDNISSMALYSSGTHNASTSITFAWSEFISARPVFTIYYDGGEDIWFACSLTSQALSKYEAVEGQRQDCAGNLTVQEI